MKTKAEKKMLKAVFAIHLAINTLENGMYNYPLKDRKVKSYHYWLKRVRRQNQ